MKNFLVVTNASKDPGLSVTKSLMKSISDRGLYADTDPEKDYD